MSSTARTRATASQFPARENAERWLETHDPKLWDIVPIDEADDGPGIGDGKNMT